MYLVSQRLAKGFQIIVLPTQMLHASIAAVVPNSAIRNVTKVISPTHSEASEKCRSWTSLRNISCPSTAPITGSTSSAVKFASPNSSTDTSTTFVPSSTNTSFK